MYQQSANSNATNSELDAKKIVKNVELTSLQRDELIEQFTEIVVDNMSHESLVCYAQEMMADYHDKLSYNELIETIDCYDPDLYDELVDNVTDEDAERELTTKEQIDYIKSNLTEED